ncbi:piggyBac transposable element-derived protein 4-like [Ylistrum balloti]|uniref:piggyBac transposable element-derived protein 4-like n=1 Tax=Ylistrum balloti TaxID=509963 RepID=UPI002905B4B6|nr:piggyBac transposable element-derived protein 4-like [Ylistrum balloti]
MANRKGLPEAVKKAKLKKQFDIIQVQKGNLIATAFKDKRQITFLSTASQPGVCENTRKPFVNLDYNAHMGGVDKFDQLSSYYPIGRPGKKWWRYILWYVINLAVVNAWILFQRTDGKVPPPPKGYDHLRFRMDIADQLKAGFTSRKHRVGRKSKKCNRSVLVAAESIKHHHLEKIEGRKKMCRECSMQKRKTPKGYPIETSYKCKFCDIPLCRVGCFAAFHDRNLSD